MKTTSAVTLLLVGAFVAACDNDERHRAFYDSKEACLKDWGTEESCSLEGRTARSFTLALGITAHRHFGAGAAGHRRASSRRAAAR
jgi:hypothetical protein